MRLKSIEIANFKAFGKEFQTIPIKPITLVFGANSAGKSSILHSLLWLNHAESRGETDVFRPALARESANLGGFDSCLNRNSGVHRLRLALTIEKSAQNSDVPSWHDDISQFKLVFTCARTRKDEPPVFTDGDLFAGNDRLLTIRKRPSSVPRGGHNVKFEWDHPALPFRSVLTDEQKEHLERWSEFLAGYELGGLAFFPTKLFLEKEDVDRLAQTDTFLKTFYRFLAHELPALVDEVFDTISRTAQEIVYLPPLREIPDRDINLRGCQIPGWRWLSKKADLCESTNVTLASIGIDHQVRIRTMMPTGTTTESIMRILAFAETGKEWGGLSYAVENARTIWESYEYSDYKRWLDQHPAHFDKMVDYWYDIIRDPVNDYLSDYFEEFPDANADEPVPDWWIKEKSKRLAESLLDDWSNMVDAVWKDEAARLFIAEDQKVRDTIVNALKETGLDETPILEQDHLQLRLHDPKRDVWVALQDVGVGTSQVLPIILEALAQQNQLIAIEQPELHLHPALQAKLGDVFIESALGENNKNTFLLETHSEHLILRILRRIRETTERDFSDWSEELKKACPDGIKPDDVAVLYVQQGQDGAEVIEMPVTADGDFSRPWPGGFFAERDDELF